jgi:hypothetical protein
MPMAWNGSCVNHGRWRSTAPWPPLNYQVAQIESGALPAGPYTIHVVIVDENGALIPRAGGQGVLVMMLAVSESLIDHDGRD